MQGRKFPTSIFFKVVDAIGEAAAETDKTVPQIALNWLLQRPTVTSVIVGARNEEQLRQNLGAVGSPANRWQSSTRPANCPWLTLLASGPIRRSQPAADSSLKDLNY
jgi:Aldo/keto reductase family